MRNDLFDEYCQLMFDLVDAHVEDVVRSGYLQDAYQEGAYARVAGYLGEVITSAFIEECKQRCHVALAPVALLNG